MVRISRTENVLADALKIRRVDFRRQVGIGPYVVDFLVGPGIVVECEGIVHGSRQNRDAERAGFIESLGYRVFRIRNYDVFSNPVMIADMIRTARQDTTNQSRKEEDYLAYA